MNIMVRDEFEMYKNLNQVFIDNCKRVVEALKRYDEYNHTNDYVYLDTFKLHKTKDGKDEVCAYGDEYCGGEIEPHSKCFDANLLMMSDEELERYVDHLIFEKEEEKIKEKEENDLKERERDIKLYNELKKKLNL